MGTEMNACEEMKRAGLFYLRDLKGAVCKLQTKLVFQTLSKHLVILAC